MAHKGTLIFLLKFFVTYFVLVQFYAVYLHETQVKGAAFVCAPITSKVAKSTVGVLRFFGYEAALEQHKKELSIKIKINNSYIARVIEGCNSVSIIILFIAFIFAFSGSLKATVLYMIFGSFIIYGVNVLRISFLTVMLYKYPGQQAFLHNLMFPAIIYGTTFLLWIVWVRNFSKYKK